jgi:NAD(P)-dependent dehydrogenase (short-subunit alcohol dehydrogenase family)
VHHLAPFLLTNLLLGKLAESAPARIIVVASEAHRRATLDFDDLMNARVGFVAAYQRSKLANLLFCRALAQRLGGSGVTVNALHPGFVSSHLFHSTPPLLRLLLATAVRPFMRSVERGASCSVYLATSAGVAARSGGYYRDAVLAEPSRAAQSDVDAARLWGLSAQLTGLERA